jgi:hypothetical protein
MDNVYGINGERRDIHTDNPAEKVSNRTSLSRLIDGSQPTLNYAREEIEVANAQSDNIKSHPW